MAQERLRYDKMIDDALRSVVRDALADIARRGLPGDHHFYVSFHTGHPGVDIPERLRAQYPDTMTIVLQYQFWALEVDNKGFAVTLSFNNQLERLVVPHAAITAFADPSVKFGLEFQARQENGADAAPAERRERRANNEHVSGNAKDEPKHADARDKAKSGEVVTLDAFRNKK